MANIPSGVSRTRSQSNSPSDGAPSVSAAADSTVVSRSNPRPNRIGGQSSSGLSVAPTRDLPLAGSGPAGVDEPPLHWAGSQAETEAHLGSADQELAAYLLARALVDRPVSPATTALLQRANETKKEVLTTMRYGRGNVTTDLDATRNEGFHRLLAQRSISGSTSSLGEDAAVTAARDAALTAHVGSGNCGEFANVALHVHAGRLLEGERLVMQHASDRDHSWLMLEGQPKADGTPRRAIIDVWREGPVTESVDNRFTDAAAAPSFDLHSIESADAPALSRQFSEASRDPGERTVRRLELLIEANARAGKQPNGTVYAPVASVSTEFQQRAKAAVEGHESDPSLRAQAVALARELVPGLPQADEQSTADAILAIAADLAAPRERPLQSAVKKRERPSTSTDSD